MLTMRVARAALAGLMLLAPLGVAADDAAPAAQAAPAAGSLDQARELIKNGEYDPAIELLRAEVARTANDPVRQREAYLQLIKTYVFLGNDYKFKPQGREMSNLNYRAASELIAEMLAIPALRNTRPEPATDYPPEMVTRFADARARMFGAFRVLEVEPVAAVVLLDGDTLQAGSPIATRGANDLPVGDHQVAVSRAGYQDIVETITISPGATLERSYRLEKKRGAMWYATRGGATAGLVGGLIALLAGRNGGTTATATPLPGAPPPPTR
jgi:hypothetical protein